MNYFKGHGFVGADQLTHVENEMGWLDKSETDKPRDSLVRDISMAKNAGIKSIWAKYGTECDLSLWRILVRVTHWTKEDVSREAELKKRFDKIIPDYTIDRFGQVIDIIRGSYKSTSDK